MEEPQARESKREDEDSREPMRKKAPKIVHQSEYATPLRRGGVRGSRQQRFLLQRNAQQSKSNRKIDREDGLSRRAQLREQRYEEKRRRQWILAVALVIILIVVIAIVRFST